MNRPEFDEFAGRYDELLADSMPESLNEDAYFASYKIDLMASRHPADTVRRILDYGCGAGRSLPYLRDRYPHAQLWGFDVSEQSISMASKRMPDAKLSADWQEIRATRFDLIIAANVFHHIPPGERPSALSDCREVLAPTGSLYVFEHNPYNPVTRHVFENCPFDVHAEMLAMRQATQLATNCSLRIRHRAYTLFFPKPLKLLRPLERFMGRLPLGAQYYVQMGR